MFSGTIFSFSWVSLGPAGRVSAPRMFTGLRYTWLSIQYMRNASRTPLLHLEDPILASRISFVSQSVSRRSVGEIFLKIQFYYRSTLVQYNGKHTQRK
jgi:hypothetical protein